MPDATEQDAKYRTQRWDTITDQKGFQAKAGLQTEQNKSWLVPFPLTATPSAEISISKLVMA